MTEERENSQTQLRRKSNNAVKDKVIGMRLKEIRRETGTSMAALAERLRDKHGYGWNSATIAHIEAGQRALKLYEADDIVDCLADSDSIPAKERSEWKVRARNHLCAMNYAEFGDYSLDKWTYDAKHALRHIRQAYDEMMVVSMDMQDAARTADSAGMEGLGEELRGLANALNDLYFAQPYVLSHLYEAQETFEKHGTFLTEKDAERVRSVVDGNEQARRLDERINRIRENADSENQPPSEAPGDSDGL